VHAAKTNLSKLIERAEKGEEIVIARGKTPVARLVPMSVPPHILRRRAFGVLKGRLKLPDAFFFDPLPGEELEAWGPFRSDCGTGMRRAGSKPPIAIRSIVCSLRRRSPSV
jgi:prevent-host-death family protein